MAYQFRMEQVLEYKQQVKDRTQKEYIEKQGRFEEIGYELYEALKKKETLQAQQSQRMMDGDKVITLQHYNQYIDQLDFQVESLQQRLKHARENMQTAHERLLSETIDVKKYEKLKERQFSRYQYDSKIEEMKATDELAVLRYTSNEIR
ncbi:flagellar export protein FliJ [Pseudalkalibacillus salsuginis]|uniref:flagellar export protein FliJ n=1 Tax=Pseudalkalibacillus salsuginis TaxID=2910972 RepID=UPI001F25258F|nr:flagellar export protein FliJ [Pseudalkalibacillus salsuginis]MCF6410568.1 flagellar export protein FliJ [Pseudalkalibacillus salsuginis]